MAADRSGHSCAVVVSAEQQAEVAAAFVQEAPDIGQRAMFLGPASEARDLERRLREQGCDTDARIRAGDLVLTDEDEVTRPPIPSRASPSAASQSSRS